MCDDYFDGWDDMDDGLFDPSDYFQEDLFDEHIDGPEGLIDEEPEEQSNPVDTNENVDMADVIIMGSMIAGNAYEEAIDRRRLKKKPKK